MLRNLLSALVFIMLVSPALAVQPDEILDDPALEARAREVGKDLRCLVCQNQSIDDSDADLARDLRVLVRERRKGRSETRSELIGEGFHLRVCLPMPTLFLRGCNFVLPPQQVRRDL